MEEVLNFLPIYLQAYRKMIVLWDPAEAGAPFFVSELPETIDDIATDDAVTQENTADKLRHLALEKRARFFINHGVLKPGTYTYQNPLAGYEYAAALSPSIATDSQLHRPPTISFTITEAHLSLLKKANFVWNSYLNAISIDCKRPYGDQSNYYFDMATILNGELFLGQPPGLDLEEHTLAAIKQYDKFHEEMFFVLQIFLLYAELTPGHYRRENEKMQWVKIDEATYQQINEQYLVTLREKFEKVTLLQQEISTIYEGCYEEINYRLTLGYENERNWINKGIICDRMKKFDEAIASYNMAITINPAMDITYAYRGVVYYQMNQLSFAKNDFTQALSINPNNNYAKSYLTYLDAMLSR